MANRNIKVIGHWVDSVSGKTLTAYGTALSYSMNIAMATGSGGDERLDPAQVQSKFSGAGLAPSSANWVTTSSGYLASYQIANGIL